MLAITDFVVILQGPVHAHNLTPLAKAKSDIVVKASYSHILLLFQILTWDCVFYKMTTVKLDRSSDGS